MQGVRLLQIRIPAHEQRKACPSWSYRHLSPFLRLFPPLGTSRNAAAGWSEACVPCKAQRWERRLGGLLEEKIPLGYEKSTTGLPRQNRVPHGYLTSKNVVYATRGVTTVVSATYGFTDLPHRYLTPSSTTSPLPDPFIYHSPTNTFFRYIMGSKVVQMVLVPFTRIAKGRECGLGRKGGEEEARVQV